MDDEIEKRYLLSALPVIPSPSEGPYEYVHGFLPGTVIKERVTLRTAGHPWTRTVKIGSGLVRKEFIEELDEATFQWWWPLTKGRRIRAKRWKVPDLVLTERFGTLHEKPLRWEVTQFLDRDGLHLVEIELPTAVPEKLPFPDWLKRYVVKEVTDDPAFETFYLAL